MSSPAYYFSKDMVLEDRNILRAAVIELVLATDMKKHFGLLSQSQVYAAVSDAFQASEDCLLMSSFWDENRCGHPTRQQLDTLHEHKSMHHVANDACPAVSSDCHKDSD